MSPKDLPVATTPTPWTLRTVHGCLYVCDSIGNSIATVGEATDYSALADAGRIVAAVNAHDDLLAALRLVIDAERIREVGASGALPVVTHAAMNAARAAVAKAEKGIS